MKMRSSVTVHGIGIDAGGTYTDAVLFDLRRYQVISTSKRPTVQHCLELSIVRALDDIFPVGRTEGVRKIAFCKMSGVSMDAFSALSYEQGQKMVQFLKKSKPGHDSWRAMRRS